MKRIGNRTRQMKHGIRGMIQLAVPFEICMCSKRAKNTNEITSDSLSVGLQSMNHSTWFGVAAWKLTATYGYGVNNRGGKYRTDGYIPPESFQFPLVTNNVTFRKFFPINKTTTGCYNFLATISTSSKLIAFKTLQTFQHGTKWNNLRSMQGTSYMVSLRRDRFNGHIHNNLLLLVSHFLSNSVWQHLGGYLWPIATLAARWFFFIF